MKIHDGLRRCGARRPGPGFQHRLRQDLDTGPAVAPAAPLLGLDGSAWFKIIEVAILSVTALLIGFFVARPLIARMFAPVSYSVAQVASSSPVAGQLPAPATASADASAQVPARARPRPSATT